MDGAGKLTMKNSLILLVLATASLYGQAGATGRIGGTGTQLFVGNPQTSTYSLITNDFQFCKVIPVSSGTFTMTLMNPTPLDGTCVRVLNYGTGTVTISRNSLTINGTAADFTIGPGTAASPQGLLVRSNGTNYDAQPLNGNSGFPATVTIASGTSSLGTSSIGPGACATVVTTTATGTASTDAIAWSTNASIKAVTGYVPATTGGLSISAYPTANNVNFDVCNWSSGSITPGPVIINWRVSR